MECVSALAKTYPLILIEEWESLKHYLEIIFNFEDERRIIGLKILEEWFSNYGTAAIVNQKHFKTNPFELPHMKDFIKKYFSYFTKIEEK